MSSRQPLAAAGLMLLVVNLGSRDFGNCDKDYSIGILLVSYLLERRTLRTRPEAKMAVFEYLEGFYHPHRRHSALDYLSPIDYERSHERAA